MIPTLSWRNNSVVLLDQQAGGSVANEEREEPVADVGVAEPAAHAFGDLHQAAPAGANLERGEGLPHGSDCIDPS